MSAKEGRAANRQKAGRLARDRGQRAEHKCARFMVEKCGRAVHRVKRGSYDLVWHDDMEWGVAQIKSYLLYPSELRRVEEEMLSEVMPPGTVLEVWMENKKRRHKGRVDKREWIAKVVGVEEE